MSAAGQRFRLSKTVSFEAAHFMGAKPAGHPYANLHGHSFRIEATIAGTVPDGGDWVADLADLTAALEAVASALDHRLLNEIEGLEEPTLERLCLWVAQALAPRCPGLANVALERPSLSERCELTLE
jgi:6-pyruvoyltetrahydropterin/6-carboxytetrahydropterin synthase